VRGEVSAAGNDRASHALQVCAQRGLQIGRDMYVNNATNWGLRQGLLNMNVCNVLPCTPCANPPCGPFPAAANGPPVAGVVYPYLATQSVTSLAPPFNTLQYDLQVGILNNQEATNWPPAVNPQAYSDNDGVIQIYSRCVDRSEGQQYGMVQTSGQYPGGPSVVATMFVSRCPAPTPPSGYYGQGGYGGNNQGNANNNANTGAGAGGTICP
jgi:hypothetical protein